MDGVIAPTNTQPDIGTITITIHWDDLGADTHDIVPTHGGLLWVPLGIDTDLASPGLRMIHHVIMYQAGGVNHLCYDRHTSLVLDNITSSSSVMVEGMAKTQGNHWSDCLSFSIKIILCHLSHLSILEYLLVQLMVDVTHESFQILFCQMERVMMVNLSNTWLLAMTWSYCSTLLQYWKLV